MTTKTTKIENGTIVLPRELWSECQESEVLIKPQQKNKLLIEKIIPKKQNVVLMWKKAAGILKNRKMPNPIAWQNKIRKEWEERK